MSYFFVSFLSVLALENCGLSNDLLLCIVQSKNTRDFSHEMN